MALDERPGRVRVSMASPDATIAQVAGERRRQRRARRRPATAASPVPRRPGHRERTAVLRLRRRHHRLPRPGLPRLRPPRRLTQGAPPRRAAAGGHPGSLRGPLAAAARRAARLPRSHVRRARPRDRRRRRRPAARGAASAPAAWSACCRSSPAPCFWRWACGSSWSSRKRGGRLWWTIVRRALLLVAALLVVYWVVLPVEPGDRRHRAAERAGQGRRPRTALRER